jgi:F0F1-type ATP synthase epsilon subunit
MVLYLSEKSEREAELKKKELEIMQQQAVKDHELKENDMKLRKESMEAAQNQNNSTINQLVELQRVQQQQFMQLMRQEQSSCMTILLNKLTSQK